MSFITEKITNVSKYLSKQKAVNSPHMFKNVLFVGKQLVANFTLKSSILIKILLSFFITFLAQIVSIYEPP